MGIKLPLDIDSVKGFLSPVEGAALYRAALECASLINHAVELEL